MSAVTPMTGRERCEQAAEHNLRVEKVVDLAAALGSDEFERPDDDLQELLDNLLDSYPVHPSIEPLRALVLAADAEDMLEALGGDLYDHNLLGFAVCFATPVMTRTSATSWTWSWGICTSRWFYADTYEEAWKLAVAWADECHANAKPAAARAPASQEVAE